MASVSRSCCEVCFVGDARPAAPLHTYLPTLAGIALLSVVKAGFLGAVHAGGGLVLSRDIQTGQWSAPCAVGIGGLSIGAQVPRCRGFRV